MEAVRAAALDVAAGEHELVLAVGAEKMRDVTSRGSLVARTANLTHPTLAKGRTAPGPVRAARQPLHGREYGVARETLARVAVKNHEHATAQPEGALPHAGHGRAGARRAARRRAVRDARLHPDDRRRRGGDPRARSSGRASNAEHYVVIRGFGLAVDERLLHDLLRPRLDDFLGFRATREAAAVAYGQAGITRSARASSTWSSATTASPSPSSSTTRTSGSAAAARAARCSRAARRRSAATSRSTSRAASSRAATRSGRRACG